MHGPTADSIKVFCFIPRRHDFSEKSFHEYWRHPHGTMAKRIKSMQRYIQAHKSVDDQIAPPAPHDGAAEIWFADVDTANRLNEDPNYSDYCGLDEPKFMDLGPDTFRVLTKERELIPGSLDQKSRGVKFLHLVRTAGTAADRMLPALENAEHLKMAKDLGVVAYSVCEALPESYVSELPPQAEVHHWLSLDPYDAVREVWFPDAATYLAAASTDSWRAFLAAPGVNLTRSPGFLATEEVVIW
ncbi:hypothetical protein GCM10023081_46260 [Arthrobacter ginkgonis]|uniref:EthD domain-containing protein n=1 Tax=Arthrobacter ginkgonis TaxID=1630594 RepID=A0ABP7DHJ7_9MICC